MDVNKRNLSDEELTNLAIQKILEETKSASDRAKRIGTYGWQPNKRSVNKKFLNNTVLANAQHNKRKDTNPAPKKTDRKRS